MMKTILITGGNSATAMKLSKLLNTYQLILADYGEMPQIRSESLKMVSLGVENRDVTAHTLLTACLDHQADILLPLKHFEIEAVAQAAVLFKEFDLGLMIPEVDEIAQLLPTRKSAVIILKYDDLFIAPTNFDSNTIANGAFYSDLDTLTLITI